MNGSGDDATSAAPPEPFSARFAEATQTPARVEPGDRRRVGAQVGSVSRRTLILGASAAAGVLAGGAYALGQARESPADPLVGPLSAWRRDGGPPYFIAHRGAGAVVPEHTLEGYQAALAWGAKCLEISVAKTSDDVLICMHDLTYDRTTSASGVIAEKPSTILARARVDIPRLGRRWQGDRAPMIPLLSEVLEAVGTRAVLCLEAKNDAAFEPMLALVRRNGLMDSVFAKLHMPARARVQQARAAGLPVFLYAGSAAELDPQRLGPVVRSLDPDRDVLVIPAPADDADVDEQTIRRVIGMGVPVWMYPVTRRGEAARLGELGVRGFLSPDIAYLTRRVAPQRSDDWAAGAMTSGQLTRKPYSDAYALRWSQPESLTLDFNRPAFVLLGQLCPIASPVQSYTLEVDVRFEAIPRDRRAHFSIAFAHDSDEYYEHQESKAPGYHAILRADGEMGLYAHHGRPGPGTPISPVVRTPALLPGRWTRLRLRVTPETLTWQRQGGASAKVRDATWRGGYLHVGRSGSDGPLSLRDLRVKVTD